jgi:hypothetical protein
VGTDFGNGKRFTGQSLKVVYAKPKYVEAYNVFI